MTLASFTEQMYLCLAISILVILYVLLLALDSPWTNKGVSLMLQDCNFPILTESIYVYNSEQEEEWIPEGNRFEIQLPLFTSFLLSAMSLNISICFSLLGTIYFTVYISNWLLIIWLSMHAMRVYEYIMQLFLCLLIFSIIQVIYLRYIYICACSSLVSYNLHLQLSLIANKINKTWSSDLDRIFCG